LSVSISVVRAVVGAVVRAGASERDLLARVPIGVRLEDADARVELEEFSHLLTAAVALTGDASLGFHIIERLPHGAIGLLPHLLSHAPTLREALGIVAQFGSLAIDGLSFPFRDEEAAFVMACTIPRSTPSCDRVLTEIMMIGLLYLARTFAGTRVVPRVTCFDYARPPNYDAYELRFGSELRFGQSEASIAFDRDLPDRKQLHQNPELYRVLRVEAQRELARVASGWTPAVRLHRYLMTLPPSRAPDMADAARSLGMSERSLRRHLAAEGTSYRDVVRSNLERSADSLLVESSHSIKEIASMLGFLNPTAFNNAFKRWKGMTPGEYRRQGRRR
jgi:AraC-like DNA-binding protein